MAICLTPAHTDFCFHSKFRTVSGTGNPNLHWLLLKNAAHRFLFSFFCVPAVKISVFACYTSKSDQIRHISLCKSSTLFASLILSKTCCAHKKPTFIRVKIGCYYRQVNSSLIRDVNKNRISLLHKLKCRNPPL